MGEDTWEEKVMNTAEKIKVMQAFLSGEEIEGKGRSGSTWISLSKDIEPSWDWTLLVYRIKEQDYSLDIPWEWIDDEWQYATMDEDGKIFLYTEHPEFSTVHWVMGKGSKVAYIGCLKINKPDVKHWKKTLTKRPEGK